MAFVCDQFAKKYAAVYMTNLYVGYMYRKETGVLLDASIAYFVHVHIYKCMCSPWQLNHLRKSLVSLWKARLPVLLAPV